MTPKILTLLTAVVAIASVARADIRITTDVELHGGRNERSGDRSVDLPRDQYPHLYLDRNRFETRAEGNTLEQVVDLAQFSLALKAFVASVAAKQPGGAAASAREAYEEFEQLSESWGGRSEGGVDNFRITYPGPVTRVTVKFVGSTDDDRILLSGIAPTESLPGISVERRSSTGAISVLFDIDLNVLHRQLPESEFYGTIPLAFAIQENPNDTWASNLKISKVLNLMVLRPETDSPVIARTSLDFGRSAIRGVESVHETVSSKLLAWNSESQGEKVQFTNCKLTQPASGGFSVMVDGR